MNIDKLDELNKLHSKVTELKKSQSEWENYMPFIATRVIPPRITALTQEETLELVTIISNYLTTLVNKYQAELDEYVIAKKI